MHPVVLNATSYTLLLSSLVALAVLLREKCKYEKKSSFFILSMSDAFSAILTAIALLTNRVEAGIKLNYNWRDDTNDIANCTWTIESEDRFPFSRIRDFRESTERKDPNNITLTCDAKDLIMQYGMLLAPLANAFISLLTFLVQCNLNAMCVKQRCSNVITISPASDIRPESKCVKVTYKKKGILQSKRESTSPQRDNVNVRRRNNIIQRLRRISKFRALKKGDKKPTGLLVMSHWLLPFLVTIILHFAEYSNMNAIQRAEDSECIFESNFPVSDFFIFSNEEDNSNILHSGTTPMNNYHFVNEGLLNKSNSNGTEVNKIISKIQNIIKVMLSQKHNFNLHNAINPFNNSGLQNTTKYLLTNVTNNIIRHIGNNTNTDKVIQRIKHATTKQDNVSEESNATKSLNRKARISVNKDNYQEDTEIYFTNTEETIIQTTTSITQNVTLLPNNQTYVDLTKHIQATSAHATVRNHCNHSIPHRYCNKERPKQNSSIQDIISTETNSIKGLFLSKNDNFYHDTDTKTKDDTLCMINKCLVSTEFLKLHLFMLTIAIYFLPILLCCLLQTRGKYICQNAIATLKATVGSTSISVSGHNNAANEPQPKCSTSTGICQRDSNEKSDVSQEIKDNNTTDSEIINKNYKREIQNKSMLLEIDCMMKILKTIQVSLVFCILLWTPIFLATLLKVFSCIRAPQWLTDTMFLGAISFSTVRNFLDISIVKIRESCSNDNAKENKIHPVE